MWGFQVAYKQRDKPGVVCDHQKLYVIVKDVVILTALFSESNTINIFFFYLPTERYATRTIRIFIF